MAINRLQTQRGTRWTLAAIFVVAVGFNYPWELAQSPLYTGMGDFSQMLWHCFVAALGDGLLVLLIFTTGWLVLRQRDWFARPGLRGYCLILVIGLVIAMAVEWAALHLAKQWEYTAQMPLVPGLNVGVTPVAQMLLLPPVIFYVVTVWRDRAKLNRA